MYRSPPAADPPRRIRPPPADLQVRQRAYGPNPLLQESARAARGPRAGEAALLGIHVAESSELGALTPSVFREVSLRILVVDDGDDIRDALKVLLELDGHDVDIASNGVEAIYKTRVQPPDVILMDLGMPVMDGFAAVRALRHQAEARDIPIIALSAYVGDKAWSDRALAAGCNACALKPVDSKKLADLLRQFAPAGGG